MKNTVELSEEDKQWILENVSENGSAIVSGNGSYKTEVNSNLNWYKSRFASKLNTCNSSTPPKEIASLLEEIFKQWPAPKENHWLSVSQNYTARTLNWVMSATVRKYLIGGIRTTPAQYFTYLLKFRIRRKEFRHTNVTC